MEKERTSPWLILFRVVFTAALIACIMFIFRNSLENGAQSSARSQAVMQLVNSALAKVHLGPLSELMDETIQLHSPNRTSSVVDVWIDMSGVVAGLLFALIILLIVRGVTAFIRVKQENRALRAESEELRRREPDAKPNFRVKIAVVGSEIDDPSLTKLIEGCGALIVSDRFCFGSTPGREVIELNDEEDVLRQICRHYMETSECARYISDEKVHQRRETADRLAREYKADGIIYEQMKYCDYWGFERALASYVMNTEYGWPVLSIDRVYNNGYSGQLRTRVQAFVESLEIKKIQRERGAK